MQLEFDFDTTTPVNKLFYMTSGLFTNELCYTTGTTYGNASGYTRDQAMKKLLKFGYTKQAATSLLVKAKRTERWIVFNYQQCFNF